MGLVTGVTLPSDGDVIRVANYNDPINKILAQVNGNLDDSNIASLSGAKISNASIANAQLKDDVFTGWRALANTPSSVTYNGQHSYSVVFSAVDLTSTLSPGMRLRTTRAVAAPTQSTSLNGTNQYWVKTSPSKMTFTDDFVVSAWIKISNYNIQAVVSRYNGTSGWEMRIGALGVADGRVQLTGYNGSSGNYSTLVSYQSIPLNKWVHITAQLDMSSFTVSPTTSYIMIDGVDVPAFVNRGGTNPTSLLQAGNLEVGTSNGGSFFTGKIAQVAVFNTKLAQTTVQGYMSQGLVGTETSLASAHSFNGVATDLNTTSPNDLTAMNSAGYTADSPFGGQANGTVSSTVDYGIIQSVTYSTNTTVVVQVPEGCTIPTNGGVTAVSYSSASVPFGFPKDDGRWTINSLYLINRSGGFTGANIWTDTGARVILPIGRWVAGMQGDLSFAGSSSGTQSGFFTLQDITPTNSRYSYDLSGRMYHETTINVLRTVYAQAPRTVAAMTPFILWAAYDSATGTPLWIVRGDQGAVELFAKNAYL